MNARTLTVDEVIEFGCAQELLRRATCGDVCVIGKHDDVFEAGYDEGAQDQGAANREEIVGDMIDFLHGEVWMDGMTDEQRAFLIEDLNLYVVGDADG